MLRLGVGRVALRDHSLLSLPAMGESTSARDDASCLDLGSSELGKLNDASFDIGTGRLRLIETMMMPIRMGPFFLCPSTSPLLFFHTPILPPSLLSRHSTLLL